MPAHGGVEIPHQPRSSPRLHRPRPRGAPTRHRHDAGHHRAQRLQHRRRPHRRRLRGQGQGRPTQPLPNQTSSSSPRAHHRGTHDRRGARRPRRVQAFRTTPTSPPMTETHRPARQRRPRTRILIDPRPPTNLDLRPNSGSDTIRYSQELMTRPPTSHALPSFGAASRRLPGSTARGEGPRLSSRSRRPAVNLRTTTVHERRLRPGDRHGDSVRFLPASARGVSVMAVVPL